MESFAKNSYRAYFFSPQTFSLKKVLKKPALKKFLTFFQNKAFLTFPEMEPGTFRPQPPIYFPKKPALKKFLILSQESPSFSGYRNLEKFLFQEMEHFILQKRELSYISGKIYQEP